METPIASIHTESFPFGKLVVSQQPDGGLVVDIDAGFRPFWSNVRWRARIWQELGTHPGHIWIQTDSRNVRAAINGDEFPVTHEKRDGKNFWLLDPYSRLPRVRDRLAQPGSERGNPQ